MPPNRTNQPNQLKHKVISPQKAPPYIIHFVLCPVKVPTAKIMNNKTNIVFFIAETVYKNFYQYLSSGNTPVITDFGTSSK